MTATLTPAPTQQLTLYDVSWETYEQLLSAFGERPIKLNYSHGILEIMIMSYQHERYKSLIARLIETLTEEMNMPIASAGSTTLKKKKLARGLEPDECFYLQNETAVRGKKEINLQYDPPPDLAIEIDITSCSVSRMSIYHAFGVLEVWRFDGTRLEFYQWSDSGYGLVEFSPAFPQLQASDLMPFIELTETSDNTTVFRQFRAWVKKNLSSE
ncbi:Uma2 family endonuclease [Pseudocalidococcus azoricus]|nr:Uma2 family endonuclease [Pseudocalidococcus azoricus]